MVSPGSIVKLRIQGAEKVPSYTISICRRIIENAIEGSLIHTLEFNGMTQVVPKDTMWTVGCSC